MRNKRRRESNYQNQLSVGRFYCAVVRVKVLDRRTAKNLHKSGLAAAAASGLVAAAASGLVSPKVYGDPTSLW